MGGHEGQVSSWMQGFEHNAGTEHAQRLFVSSGWKWMSQKSHFCPAVEVNRAEEAKTALPSKVSKSLLKRTMASKEQHWHPD